MDSWEMLNLQKLQHFDPNLQRFRHIVCDSWLLVDVFRPIFVPVFDPLWGMNKSQLKIFVGSGWISPTRLEVAFLAAIDLVPASPSPISVLKKDENGHVIGLTNIGPGMPSVFWRTLQRQTGQLADGGQGVEWHEGLHALVSLDLDWRDPEAAETFRSASRSSSGVLGKSLEHVHT